MLQLFSFQIARYRIKKGELSPDADVTRQVDKSQPINFLTIKMCYAAEGLPQKVNMAKNINKKWP